MLFHHAVEGKAHRPLLQRLGGERHAQGERRVGQPNDAGKRRLANYQSANILHFHQFTDRIPQRLLRFVGIFMTIHIVIGHNGANAAHKVGEGSDR